ncbi:iron-containing redox enzyme family protein [Aetokthonos hydrillicola Thurmond2011]|jgi:pyrroloquinoline quinone (PQQ) biosynthesis protein C|uniref:Iron-containing redox enzyme family protein n=1 Tax=Aetokthonos hydrillicola Thurmond2011 TaxID=2712845 RepID=A0AAP5IAX1_9CYAN|nr:iron-containing redox enzyme family protein [Aetokthonos hydrillicola]MBO3461602.1 iron-containing redox enzyme family protein [Aetokthonos hydrillicola CCALA 1050]MBW4589301.1 iron-containing redox enzyme family protein [Aetokthonos hydrillicola CCALA 1050]MDR9898165.1 iron-containing redox enzyme family protein [Aetokthonos hydrillicola Thurmond2011]
MKDFVAYIQSLYPQQDTTQILTIQRADIAEINTIRPVKEILQYARHHEILSSPWLIAFQKGLLSKEVITNWLQQRYLLSWCFPNWLTSVVAKLTTSEARIPLLNNLYEEHGLVENSTHSNKPHSQMWQQLFEELGILRIGESLPLPVSARDLFSGTQFYIQTYTEACFNHSVFIGLGAISFTEAILPYENKLILEGLQRLGISQNGQEFFRLHCECDETHANEIIHVMEQIADSPREIQQVWQGVEMAAIARKAFYDTLLSASVEKKIALDLAI